MDFSKETIKKIKGLIIFTIIVIVCLVQYERVLGIMSYIFGILLPFILGGAIAFILNVPMSFIERHVFKKRNYKNKKTERVLNKIMRPTSLLLTFLFVAVLIAIIILVVVPQLGVTFTSLGVSIQSALPELEKLLTNMFSSDSPITEFVRTLEFDWSAIMQYAFNFLQVGAGSVIDVTLSFTIGFFSVVTTGFIALIFAIYVLVQKETLGTQARKVLFAFVRRGRAEAVMEIMSLTYKTFANFLTGQCTEAVILGTIFIVVLTLFGMPFAFLIGIFIMFAALIPIFGAFLGCGLGVLLILIEDPIQAVYFVIIFIVIQQIEGNLIYPYVVGSSVGLPAIWVLVAVTIGGSLGGVVGMIIAIPLFSVLNALFKEVVYLKLKKNGIDPKELEG